MDEATSEGDTSSDFARQRRPTATGRFSCHIVVPTLLILTTVQRAVSCHSATPKSWAHNTCIQITARTNQRCCGVCCLGRRGRRGGHPGGRSALRCDSAMMQASTAKASDHSALDDEGSAHAAQAAAVAQQRLAAAQNGGARQTFKVPAHMLI